MRETLACLSLLPALLSCTNPPTATEFRLSGSELARARSNVHAYFLRELGDRARFYPEPSAVGESAFREDSSLWMLVVSPTNADTAGMESLHGDCFVYFDRATLVPRGYPHRGGYVVKQAAVQPFHRGARS